MEELIRRMLPVGSRIPNNKNEIEYSFAVEYNGPPVPYDLPRVTPIDIESIPTALVVSATSLSDRLSLPVVQPLLTSSALKTTSRELSLGSDLVVSPTSVITFDRTVHDGPDHGSSGLTSSSGAVGSAYGHESSDGIDSSGLLDISNSHDLSCELSDEKESSGTVRFSNGHDLSDGIESSDMLVLSNGNNRSQELSGGEIRSSGPIDLLDDHKESVDFSNDLNPLDWNSSELAALSSQFPSSEASSFKAEECETHPLSLKRTSLVTFRDTEPELSDMVHMECIPVEAENVDERKGSESKINKGLCHRCLKGSRFTEKEACIVCNAKYCANCVLRAMGSMPEGRKCVTCIGLPVDESKRGNLGKCSRMLKRLLSELEIKQAMKAEKFCEANQLQPKHIYVNGKQLSQEEMVLLQGCSHPPSKLKPGSYWYDKVSGLWGQEGHKPCKIISPHLNVGGLLMANASNGNTQVFINNREITKVELRMLRLAGVQCAGNPHFWVNADGSYQEEGQKKMKGNIWDKAVAKLYCSVVSLPIPSNSNNPSEEEVYNLVSRPVPDYLEQRTLQKLLLLGYDGSGTSTIFKQAKFLYKHVPFSDDERESIKMMIQSNVYNYLGILLEGRERFEEESLTETRKKRLLDQSAGLGEDASDDKTIYNISPRLKTFSDWLLKVMVSGNLEAIFPAATREYAPLVEELWKDAAIQATYSRRSELHMLPDVSSYFLERIVDISRMEYEPSNEDILYAEGVTSSNGLAHTDFLISQSTYDCDADGADQHDLLLRYQLIRVHSKGLGENCKWLEMFEDLRIVIFSVSMIDYDQVYDEETGVAKNKMMLSKKLFESIATHPSFEEADFLLILNKFDLLEKKIERAPLTQCEWFADFDPVVSRHHRSNNSKNPKSYNSSPAQQAFHYMAVKFKRLFFSLTGRKLYVSYANALVPESVDGMIRYAREILKWREEQREAVSFADSAYSTEPSSFSH